MARVYFKIFSDLILLKNPFDEKGIFASLPLEQKE